MKVTIGTGEFKIEPRIWPFDDKNLSMLLESKRFQIDQTRYCNNRPSHPNPLKDSFDVETHVQFFSPFDAGVSVLGGAPKPNERQAREMNGMIRKFMRRAGLTDRADINKSFQEAFGTYSFNVPWADIMSKAGSEYSVRVTSGVVFRHFVLPQVAVKSAKLVVSLPYKAFHNVSKIEKCTETGLVKLDGLFIDFAADTKPVAPLKKAAKKARALYAEHRRSALKATIKGYEEELAEMDAEQPLLDDD